MKRMVTTLALGIVAIFAAWVAWGALSNLWADYRDSPVSTYLLIGLPLLAVAVAAVAAAVLLWRER